MPADYSLRYIDHPPVRASCLIAKQRKSVIRPNLVTFHQDSLRLLDGRAPSKSSFEAPILGEAAEHDLDHVLPRGRVVVDDVRKDAELRRFFDEAVVRRAENGNHRAGRFLDDAIDQFQCMARVVSHPHKRHIWLKTLSQISDVVRVDFARDDLVPERVHERCDDCQPLRPLIRDQDAEIPGWVLHR